MLGLSLGDDALQETVCFTGLDVAQMFTRCPLFVRAYAPNQERGSGPEKAEGASTPQSRSVPPSVVLRHQRHANAREQARFSKSASLGGCFLLCHKITRVKETCVFVLASCGAKSLRCGVLSQRI